MTPDNVTAIAARLKYHVTGVEQHDDVFCVYVTSNARLAGKAPFKRFADVGLLFLGYGWDVEKGHFFRVLEIRGE